MNGSTEKRIVYGMFQIVSCGESGSLIQNSQKLQCLSEKQFMNNRELLCNRISVQQSETP